MTLGLVCSCCKQEKLIACRVIILSAADAAEYDAKGRVLTPPGKSWIFFSLKIPGPGKSWKITLVLESPEN